MLPAHLPRTDADQDPGADASSDLPDSPALSHHTSAPAPTFSLSRAVTPTGEVVAFPTSEVRLPGNIPPAIEFTMNESDSGQATSGHSDASVATEADDETAPLYARNATHIPAGWLFKGDMESGNNIHLNCHVVGKIEVDATHACVLQVDSNVEGAVRSTHLNLHGTFNGQVNSAGGKVLIHDTARVTGEVRYSDISIYGGVHQMHIVHSPRA